MDNETKNPLHPDVSYEKTGDFVSHYANNTRFEKTVFDLKIVFGESDLSRSPEVIKQHTAITIPWPVVRLGIYYLSLNLAWHELENGTVSIPPSQIPPPFPDLTPEQEANPLIKQAAEIAKKLRDQFLASLP